MLIALARKPVNVLCFYILFRPIVQPFAFLKYKFIGSIPLTSLFALTMIAIGLFHALASRKATLFPKNAIPLYGIIFVAIASMAVTISIQNSISDIFKLILNLSIFILAYNAITTLNDIKKIAYSLAITSILPSIYGYYQYITKTGHAWKSAYYAGPRPDSFLGEYNAYGEFLCLSILGTLLAFILEENKRRKLFLIVILLNSGLSLILSLNRGSWIAISISLIIATAVVTRGKSYKYIIPIGLVVILVFGGIIKERFASVSLSSTDTTKNTLAGRIAGWEMILPLVEERFLTGYGAGTSTTLYEKHFNLSLAPHNDYIRITSEIGILGCLLYTFFIFREFITNYIRSRRRILLFFPCFSCSTYILIMSITQNLYTNVTIFPMALILYSIAHKSDLMKIK